LALGAVGMIEDDTFGDTLTARLRGPEGAEGGGGVLFRAYPAAGGAPPTSDWLNANGGRGDTLGCVDNVRDTLGPVGAAKSVARAFCGAAGETGCELFIARPRGTFGAFGTTGGGPA